MVHGSRKTDWILILYSELQMIGRIGQFCTHEYSNDSHDDCGDWKNKNSQAIHGAGNDIHETHKLGPLHQFFQRQQSERIQMIIKRVVRG